MQMKFFHILENHFLIKEIVPKIESLILYMKYSTYKMVLCLPWQCLLLNPAFVFCIQACVFVACKDYGGAHF